MIEKLIIAIVVIIAVIAHIWLFKWVKFKVDEGVITNALKQLDHNNAVSSQDIALATKMSEKLVAKVCHKSQQIKKVSQDIDAWKLV